MTARTGKYRLTPGEKLRGDEKVSRIPVRNLPTVTAATSSRPRKPEWIRVRIPASAEVARVKRLLREHRLATVCEEAACPNIGECFGHGTATFMIMGDICTRRCPFCDVAHGRPLPLDRDEPRHLAEAIADLGLRYVVVTSVDRDDLPDSGAGHFAECIRAVRERNPEIMIEVLVPDFRGRMNVALDIIAASPPNVFNHNLETVPRLYRTVRPGADYRWSLALLRNFKARVASVPSKSGLMLGLGESLDEVREVMRALRRHDVDMLTLGQYLQPGPSHLPVQRFVHPDEFEQLRLDGLAMGFSQVASAPLVRSSYHADLQARGDFPR